MRSLKEKLFNNHIRLRVLYVKNKITQYMVVKSYIMWDFRRNLGLRPNWNNGDISEIKAGLDSLYS